MFKMYVALAFLASCLVACTAPTPYRLTTATPPSNCAKVFEDARNAQRLNNGQELDYDGKNAPCWGAAHEYTSNYDLFLVEFDDHGWLSTQNGYRESSRIKWLMRQLDSLLQKDGGTPLNLIVYTHGWHHSAAPGDQNINAFRDLLERAGRVELHLSQKDCNGNGLAQVTAAPNGPRKIGTRVVGVYIGWRGDSVTGPGLRQTSIWDRKLAAEEVAQGAVQELFASLHNFYLAHACHSSSEPLIAGERGSIERNPRTDVQMLTIGHSFGALITYRALAGRLMANIVGPAGRPTNPAAPAYTHSFGDLVVLINPAFEGVHFEALARAASERQYQTGLPGQGTHGAQKPTLIILQSEGDDATKLLFPAFRRFSTLFSSAQGAAQDDAILRGVGWTDRYVTHRLNLEAPLKPLCASNNPYERLECKVRAERAWRNTQSLTGYQSFGQPRLSLSNDLVLTQCRVNNDKKLVCGGSGYGALVPDSQGLDRPSFMPIWVVRTDAAIIKDHDDFLNVHLVDFVRQIYYTVLEK
jgi:hypothetical protein